LESIFFHFILEPSILKAFCMRFQTLSLGFLFFCSRLIGYILDIEVIFFLKKKSFYFLGYLSKLIKYGDLDFFFLSKFDELHQMFS